MSSTINRKLFLVKEHVGMFKATRDYDILDPTTGELLLECREEKLGWIARLFRFSDYRRTTPFDLRVRTPDGHSVLRVARGVPVFVSKVRVYDGDDSLIGSFKQKSFSLRANFDVLDAQDGFACRLEGGLTGRDVRFLGPNDVEMARIIKQWGGLGKELLTGAGDYMLEIDDAVPEDTTLRQLILASAICLGMMKHIDIP